jgi:putative endonuclease
VKAEHLAQGEDAEIACCNFLKSRGMKLIEKNFSCRLGEIDIIMRDSKVLVFVEVRFRKNNAFGGALESITAAKQNKLRKTAEYYMQQNRRFCNARFDVVAMSLDMAANKTGHYRFDWIKNAF